MDWLYAGIFVIGLLIMAWPTILEMRGTMPRWLFFLFVFITLAMLVVGMMYILTTEPGFS